MNENHNIKDILLADFDQPIFETKLAVMGLHFFRTKEIDK
jgi:hypothetical protein